MVNEKGDKNERHGSSNHGKGDQDNEGEGKGTSDMNERNWGQTGSLKCSLDVVL